MYLDTKTVINILSQRGRSPLHCACAKGHLEVVIFLLHHEADILVEDEDGNTPLHIAVENRQTHIVQQLLEHGNPTDSQNYVSIVSTNYVGK